MDAWSPRKGQSRVLNIKTAGGASPKSSLLIILTKASVKGDYQKIRDTDGRGGAKKFKFGRGALE